MEDTPVSLAPFAKLKLTHMGALTDLAEVVRVGGPVKDAVVEVANNPHWEGIVTAIAAQSVPAASVAAEVLGLADAGEISILDVGGGSGIYSGIWLEANPAARAVQLDWEPINEIARRLLAERGVGDRFTTIDGDFHTTDFGTAQYDVAVYSTSPTRRARRATWRSSPGSGRPSGPAAPSSSTTTSSTTTAAARPSR